MPRLVAIDLLEVTRETVAGWGVDGCSAPNFAMSLGGLARGMAKFAAAREDQGARQSAMARLALPDAAEIERAAPHHVATVRRVFLDKLSRDDASELARLLALVEGSEGREPTRQYSAAGVPSGA